HRWRAEAGAVAVGIGTALADDPLLTARDVDEARQPLRVVFDSTARLPLDSRLVGSASEAPVLVVASERTPEPSVAALRDARVEVGTVEALERDEDGARLRVAAELAAELAEGDSVAVAGTCLTVAEIGAGSFVADAINQTLSLTTLGALRTGERVNLEPALQAG